MTEGVDCRSERVFIRHQERHQDIQTSHPPQCSAATVIHDLHPYASPLFPFPLPIPPSPFPSTAATATSRNTQRRPKGQTPSPSFPLLCYTAIAIANIAPRPVLASSAICTAASVRTEKKKRYLRDMPALPSHSATTLPRAALPVVLEPAGRAGKCRYVLLPKLEKLAMHTRSNLLQADTSGADRYLSANRFGDNPWAEIANLSEFWR
ncbi:hypothetical protein DFP73DRAFT_303547 [Morchella snyderi]|nr:hypothetical protein DFP73DRAFT_303547 [Morchella snyderi]